MEPLHQVCAADFGVQMRLIVSQSEDRVLAKVFRTTKKAAWVKVWEGRDSFTMEEARALAEGAARNYFDCAFPGRAYDPAHLELL